MGCSASIALSLFFPLSYVGFLYVFDRGGTDRNDPKSVRRRFIGATVNSILSILITWAVLSRTEESPLQVMGFHLYGTLAALAIPSFLVGILYSGHWLMMAYDESLGLPVLSEWKYSLQDITYVRDSIMAPITEEIAFRACSATLMAQCLSPSMTVLLCPVPFALSHLHHVRNDMRNGYNLPGAIMIRGFQMIYTYAFGAYATHLFLSSGHILAPIISHSICNSIGLPQLSDISLYDHRWQRISLWCAHGFGVIAFACLLLPLSQRSLYMSY